MSKSELEQSFAVASVKTGEGWYWVSSPNTTGRWMMSKWWAKYGDDTWLLIVTLVALFGLLVGCMLIGVALVEKGVL